MGGLFASFPQGLGCSCFRCFTTCTDNATAMKAFEGSTAGLFSSLSLEAQRKIALGLSCAVALMQVPREPINNNDLALLREAFVVVPHSDAAPATSNWHDKCIERMDRVPEPTQAECKNFMCHLMNHRQDPFTFQVRIPWPDVPPYPII